MGKNTVVKIKQKEINVVANWTESSGVDFNCCGDYITIDGDVMFSKKEEIDEFASIIKKMIKDWELE